MTRKEEIINYAKSYQGKGVESEELKDIIKLAIIDGALWADAHPKWKPSDEQMEIIYKYAEQNNYDGSVLTSLYRDLKKLKGE